MLIRSNFDPLANFTPSVITNKNGNCSITFKLPDNLTRYRIWAIASTEKCFGLDESSISVTLPLTVRPSFPRFLNFGDKCDVNVVLQNQFDTSLDVYLAMRSTNASVIGSGGYKLKLNPRQRVNLLVPISTQYSGIAHFQTLLSSGKFSDCVENQIPIYTPATTEVIIYFYYIFY